MDLARYATLTDRRPIVFVTDGALPDTTSTSTSTSTATPTAAPGSPFRGGAQAAELYAAVLAEPPTAPPAPPAPPKERRTKRRRTGRAPPSHSHAQRPGVHGIVSQAAQEKAAFVAAEDGDVEGLRRLLLLPGPGAVSPDVRDSFGCTLLMVAASLGQEAVVASLLAEHPTVDAAAGGPSGRTAAQIAQRMGHDGCAALLDRHVQQPHPQRKRGRHSSGSLTAPEPPADALSPRREAEAAVAYPWHCPACKCDVSRDRAGHLLSVAHQVAAFPAQTKPHNFSAMAIPRGYQLLKRNGWDESSGLGPTSTGRLFPVKTTLKRDRRGLGCDPPAGLYSSSAASTPRVTHFAANDSSAVRPAAPPVRLKSKRELVSAQERDKRRDRRLRALLS